MSRWGPDRLVWVPCPLAQDRIAWVAIPGSGLAPVDADRIAAFVLSVAEAGKR